MRCTVIPESFAHTAHHSLFCAPAEIAPAGNYPGRHVQAVCSCGGVAAQWLHDRMTISMTRRMFLGGAAAALVPFIGFQTSKAIAKQPAAPDRPVLLTNLRLFDGASGTVREGVNILVEGNQITALPSVTEPIENARVIDCGGRLTMPGLIDAHWHSMFCGLTEMAAMTADLGYVYLVAAREAENTLLRGFTSVREQLMLGASQIKLMAGGGVSSHYDPLDSTQYSETEVRAAVGAAEDWGTYVMVHVYTSRGIQRAIRAGVRSIEHGQLADQDAAKLMADEGVWWKPAAVPGR